MTHSDWALQRERLSAYLDGELALVERADLEAHLATCEQCQQELAALRQTRALLRALPSPALPRSFTLPAEPAQPAVVASRRRGRRVPAWTRPVQAVGGIAAMIGLGLLVTTTLPLVSHPMASGAATSAGESHTANGASTAPPADTSPTFSGATVTAGPDHAPIHAPPNNTHTQTAQPFPVAPVAGVTLLVGGAAAAAAGGVARRRARRADLAEPAA